MYEVFKVNPFRCRVWEEHGRLDEYITEASCKEEIESMRLHGQLVQAIGRPVRNDPSFDVEVICGARRLFAARYLNLSLSVELRELTHRDAVVVLDIENRQRRDLSPYERGRSFARWLSLSYFESQDDLARALRVSASQVSRLLKVAKLPSVIVDAFADPVSICENWGLELFTAWSDPRGRRRLAERARELKAQHGRRSALGASLISVEPSYPHWPSSACMSVSSSRPVARQRLLRSSLVMRRSVTVSSTRAPIDWLTTCAPAEYATTRRSASAWIAQSGWIRRYG